MKEPLFRVWDKRDKVWVGGWPHGINEGKVRPLEEYGRELGLISMDMEGFRIDENRQLYLLDECGGVAFCPAKRFQVCFPKESVDTLEKSPSGNYLILPE